MDIIHKTLHINDTYDYLKPSKNISTRQKGVGNMYISYISTHGVSVIMQCADQINEGLGHENWIQNL